MWYMFQNVVGNGILIRFGYVNSINFTYYVYHQYIDINIYIYTPPYHTFPTCDLRRLKLFTNLSFSSVHLFSNPEYQYHPKPGFPSGWAFDQQKGSQFHPIMEKSQDLRGPRREIYIKKPMVPLKKMFQKVFFFFTNPLKNSKQKPAFI